MIYKNEDGTNRIQFGTGDIEIGNGGALMDDGKESYPCCMFAPKGPGEIGEYCRPIEEHNDPAIVRPDAHTMFVFTDPRSIDVVIDHLKQAKERFKRNGSTVLSMQEITDEVADIG